MKAFLVWPHGLVWAYRAVLTQANAAGGAIKADFTPGQAGTRGSMYRLLSLAGTNSGTNGLEIYHRDEDNNTVRQLAGVASAAGVNVAIPQTTSLAQTSTLISDSSGQPILVSGNDYLSVEQTAAGAQNDTLTVMARFLLRGRPPLVTKARSTNAANVTIATPTISRVV